MSDRASQLIATALDELSGTVFFFDLTQTESDPLPTVAAPSGDPGPSIVRLEESLATRGVSWIDRYGWTLSSGESATTTRGANVNDREPAARAVRRGA